MTPPLTGRALRAWLSDEVRKLHRRACEDHGVSASSIAGVLERSAGLVQGWWTTKPAPLYHVASRRAVPDPLFERIVADLRALRLRQGEGLATSAEAATARLIVLASDVIGSGGRALLDRTVDADERRAMRPGVAALREWCSAWLEDDARHEAAARGSQR